MFRVFHFSHDRIRTPEDQKLIRELMFGASEDIVLKALRENLYELVAMVETDDINVVWERTNSIDCYWGKNSGVVEVGEKHRSSMVGDIFIDSSGRAFVVASIGFHELPETDEITLMRNMVAN